MSIFLSAFLPVLLAIFFLVYIDRYKPEPWKQLAKAVFFGILSCFPALILEAVFGPLLGGSPAGEAASAGIFEEASKLYFLYLILKQKGLFDEHIDGIVYAVCVGVGFTFLENIEYFVMYPDSIDGRILMPGHYIFAVAMGYFLSMARFSDPARKKTYLVLAFLVPAFIHWLWDFILMASDASWDSGLGGGLILLFLIFYAFSIFFSVKLVKRQSNMDAQVREEERLEEVERIKREAVEEYLRGKDECLASAAMDDSSEAMADSSEA